jgi:hypothetical protein
MGGPICPAVLETSRCCTTGDALTPREWHRACCSLLAHDSAVETYGEGGRAHRVAFAALKHQYEKKGDKWVKKAEKGPSDPQAARGPTTERKSTEEPRAPTARGKVARTEQQARRKAAEVRKEDAAARRHIASR